MNFSEFKGQEHAKRAIEVALAGSHYLIIMGGQGQGKTALLRSAHEMCPINAHDSSSVFEENPCSSIAMIAAMRPCPCGNYASDIRECTCTVEEVGQYLEHLYKAKADMYVQLAELDFHHLADPRPGETSEVIMARVDAARKIRRNVKQHPDQQAMGLLKSAYTQLYMTPAQYFAAIGVAKTVAALAGEDEIGPVHMAEAIAYRKRLP